MSEIVFQYPYIFALLIIFILGAKYLPLRAESIMIPHLYIIKKLSSTNSILIESLKWSIIVFAIIALASPIKESNIVQNNKKGYNIALILDASASMQELGFDLSNRNLDKFSIVKNIVMDFIDKRENDNIAITVFGTFSFVAVPLTYDKAIVKDITNNLQLGMAGDNTAIYDGLAQSINILAKNQEAHNSVAILLTDGRNTAGSIPQSVSIKLAKKYGIKVHTIGIGRDGDFNKYTLKSIAEDTGGKAYIASDKYALEDIYEEINMLEKSKIKANSFVKKDYYYQYPLFLAILSFIFYIYLRNRRS
jgi:Ca-activated chloride channel family protein